MNTNFSRLFILCNMLCLMLSSGLFSLAAGVTVSPVGLNHASGEIVINYSWTDFISDRVDSTKSRVTSKVGGKSRATDHHIRLAMSHQNTGKVVCVPGKEQAKITDGYSVNSFEGSQIQVLVYAAKNRLVVKGVDKGRLYIFTCMGKQVYFGKLKDNIELDITSLLDGCYTLKIEKEGQVFSRQIIIRR